MQLYPAPTGTLQLQFDTIAASHRVGGGTMTVTNSVVTNRAIGLYQQAGLDSQDYNLLWVLRILLGDNCEGGGFEGLGFERGGLFHRAYGPAALTDARQGDSRCWPAMANASGPEFAVYPSGSGGAGKAKSS